jgi:peroxiredoxin
MLIIGMSATTPDKTEGYKIGDKATDFLLRSTSNEIISLGSYPDAKGFIITFTCNHCPYSVMYEDRLIALHEKYAPMGYPVIAINPNDPAIQPDDSFEKMQERAKEKGFPFDYVFDMDQKVSPIYGATKTPHIFILDANHVVKYIGAIDDSPRDADAVSERYVENAIMALQNGKNPNPATTKAIGCSIKI